MDLTEVSVDQAEAIAHAVDVTAEPFDLVRGPLLRVRVLRVTDRDRLLVAVAHRLALDPTALDAFLVEHGLAYTRLRQAPEAPARGATEPGWPSVEECAAARERWLERLSALPVLDLPTDRPHRPRPTRTGAVEPLALPTGLARRLRDVRGIPDDPAVLFAGVAALVARLTPQSAVPLVVPVRPSPAETDTLLGRPETDVVVSALLDGSSTFQDVADQVGAELARARMDAAALPPGALADQIGSCGDPGRQPVPVRVAVRRRTTTLPAYSGVSCTSVDLPVSMATRDLSFAVDLCGDTAGGVLEYDTGLFEPITAQRIVRRFGHLLAAAVENPRAPVTTLPVLPPDERALVVSGWNRTERAFPRDRTAASLFEEQVSRDREARAVEHEGAWLTYGELNERANRLAHRLIDRGVGPDVPVGVCLPRSIDTVVCLVAVLKAGGAYLPLDPEHPVERLAYVVEDAGARVVLTNDVHTHAFSVTAADVISLDALDGSDATRPTTNPVVATTAEHLAYVIYTSGSTGSPKGVAVAHRALSRLVKGADYARLGPDEVHLQLSPLSFDASLLELWGSLLNGGTLVLPPSGLPFPDLLEVALRQHRITVLLLVSPQLHIAAEQFPEALARVPQLLVGGDVLSPSSAAELLPYLDGTRLVHVYGPTECTLFATWKHLEAVDTTRPTVPLGRPITNTRTYVLDENLAPVPVGVPGELWLGGDGLAREYLGRPDLTAARFLADPFGPPGGRIYRTGDLARWLPDGDLEFLGRCDDQIKIRGYRIELGEVDAALAAHPDVRAVATVVRDDAPGGRALAAYLVGDTHPRDVELREHMATRVPSYMIPAAFVWLDRIPLTGNGKVDRNSLPPPEFGGARHSDAPRSTMEDRVLDVMAATLGLDVIGPDDDFFELGGNSLLMVDLFTRLEELAPSSGLNLVDLLEYRTGACIAGLLEAPGGGT
ncbi:amino acid adenylation domain-containing protein [Actinopolyspora biskrensis]|uniref:Amino acid adenylation domain-containing protein n=1 Tax=Actinopolyspora biskrensis TaxID=1470178 RepID=A0A852Z4W3_9ACTN|nr:amino acid adenylation domain-containing protein [Actinopolyspora biskrensis]